MAEWKNGPIDISPAEASYDASRLPLLEAHLASRVDSGKLQAASFLMARDGKIFAHEATGRLTYKTGSKPLTTESLKDIASITKVITATAVMKLVENGSLWLEQPVKTILKEFDNAMHGGINIKHLLTHTSGLTADGGYFAEPYPIERWDLLGSDDWLTKAVLAGPVQCKPGEQWNYCSVGFAALAEIVSRVSGVHFNEYVEKEIFAPLGMTRSFLDVPQSLWPEVCVSVDWGEESLRLSGRRKGAPKGGGGAFSTLRDLFVFAQMTMNAGAYNGARILGKKTVQEMTRNQLSGVPAFHWGKHLTDFRQGLGWGFFCDGSTVGPASYNHEGWGWCQLHVDPVERFVFVMFLADPNQWNPELMVETRAIAFSGII